MIYFRRTLWLIGYLFIFILELGLFVIGIPVFIIGAIITYIKTLDIENTPDWLVPGVLSSKIDYWYKTFQR